MNSLREVYAPNEDEAYKSREMGILSEEGTGAFVVLVAHLEF